MMVSERKMIVYIAMSLDGYIATKDDDLAFLSMVESAGEDYGYAAFIQTVDAVIVGRKTYDKVLSMGYDFPHSDKDAYIITKTPREPIGQVKFYTGDLTSLVQRLKSEPGKHIYCDGGASIVHALMQDNLIDEWIISIIPVFLGGGIPLFKEGRPEQKLTLVSSRAFEKGLVQLHYTKAAN